MFSPTFLGNKALPGLSFTFIFDRDMSTKNVFFFPKKNNRAHTWSVAAVGETEGCSEDSGGLQQVGPVRGAGSRSPFWGKSEPSCKPRTSGTTSTLAYSCNTRPTPMQDTNNRKKTVWGEGADGDSVLSGKFFCEMETVLKF